MAKSEDGENMKPDGLEIISIGSLYQGVWDKKYWSSSRGKDRFPYPVGYKAIRAYEGITYKMEIKEGHKGPLFSITDNDGLSCSGQSPDRAWENFQKNGMSQTKLWHGKKVSGTLDGVEFFGFKNPLVQRLLRELMANINGTVENSLLVSGTRRKASKMQVVNMPLEACNPDMLPLLIRPVTKKKQKGRAETKPRELRSGNVIDNTKQKKLSFEDKGTCSAMPIEGRALSTLKSQDMNDADLFAPDTFDYMQEDEITCQVKKELNAMDTAVAEGSVAEPHLEEAAVSNLLHTSSEENASDSVGQEISGSMMSILLPQAVPLLKKASRKKYTKNNLIEAANDHSASNPVPAPTKNAHAKDEETIETETVVSDVSNLENTASIIPDSFEETELEIHGVNQIISSSKETVPASFEKMSLVEKDQKDDMEKPPPCLLCTSPRKNIQPEEFRDPCSNTEKDPVQVINHSTRKDGNNPSNAFGDVGRPTKLDRFTQDCIMNEKSSGGITPDKKAKVNVYTRKKGSTRRYSDTSSEKNDSRRNHKDDSGTKLTPAKRAPLVAEIVPLISANCQEDRTHPSGNEASHEEQQPHNFDLVNNSREHTVLSNNTTPVVPHTGNLSGDNHDKIKKSSVSASNEMTILTERNEDPVASDCLPVPSVSQLGASLCNDSPTNAKEVLGAGTHCNVKTSTELEGIVDLLGCYFHPMPISSVFLRSTIDEIYICVSCGHAADKLRTLFLYKVVAKEPSKGCPFLLGHTAARFPFVEDTFGRDIVPETSGLQFTPDGQYLILLDSIKMPCCRDGNIDCLCSNCTSTCEYTALKIVEVKSGHVSLVTKLRMIENIRCLLVCDPNYVVAVGRNGRLHAWVMNLNWSASVEDFDMPVNKCMSSCVVELKKIPKCANYVLGHNGLGAFTIWDISKRAQVTSFSSPGISVHQFLPISLFDWQPVSSATEDLDKKITTATKLWFSKNIDNSAAVINEREDFAIWVLVCAASSSNAQHISASCPHDESPKSCWRLALLVNNSVIMGSELEPRTIAIGASSGHGIVGTDDGIVYMWNLSTGEKLGTLHDFNGCRVPCIGVDDSGSGNLCIASDDGQLLVYSSLGYAPWGPAPVNLISIADAWLRYRSCYFKSVWRLRLVFRMSSVRHV